MCSSKQSFTKNCGKRVLQGFCENVNEVIDSNLSQHGLCQLLRFNLNGKISIEAVQWAAWQCLTLTVAGP